MSDTVQNEGYGYINENAPYYVIPLDHMEEGHLHHVLMTDHNLIRYRLRSKGNLYVYDEKLITYESNLMYSCNTVILSRVLFRVVDNKKLYLLKMVTHTENYNIVQNPDVLADPRNPIALCELMKQEYSGKIQECKPPIDNDLKSRLLVAFFKYYTFEHLKCRL